VKLYPYLKQDIQTQIARKASSGFPKGISLRGIRIEVEEVAKTVRDAYLFAWNDTWEDVFPNPQRKEYHLEVYKGDHVGIIYDGKKEVMRFSVGTGLMNKPTKDYFGDYVTPNGQYMVIAYASPRSVADEFGKYACLFGTHGFYQTSGPNAPKIGIHAPESPEKLGKDSTHGCVNVPEEIMVWMDGHMQIGSTMRVQSGFSPKGK
jgi:hypothetical protein